MRALSWKNNGRHFPPPSNYVLKMSASLDRWFVKQSGVCLIFSFLWIFGLILHCGDSKTTGRYLKPKTVFIYISHYLFFMLAKVHWTSTCLRCRYNVNALREAEMISGTHFLNVKSLFIQMGLSVNRFRCFYKPKLKINPLNGIFSLIISTWSE